MNTFKTITLGLLSLSLCAVGGLTGCNTPIETEDSAERASEAGEALTGAVVDSETESPAVTTRLQFKHSGLCIGAATGVNGAPLVQKTCLASDATILFDKEYAVAPRPTTQFRLHYQPDPSLCVHIAGPSFDNGGLVALYTCDPSRDNQWFNQDTPVAGYGGIRAVHSDLCLAQFGSLTTVGGAVYQWGTPCAHDWQLIRQFI